jgi:hypothetical protein
MPVEKLHTMHTLQEQIGMGASLEQEKQKPAHCNPHFTTHKNER